MPRLSDLEFKDRVKREFPRIIALHRLVWGWGNVELLKMRFTGKHGVLSSNRAKLQTA